MRQVTLEKILYWIVRISAYLLPFTLLIVAYSMFFPFITGKNFAFRIIVELMTAAWVGLLVIDFKKYWSRWNFVSIALTVFIAVVFVSAIFGVDFKNSFWSNFERMEGIVTLLHLLALFFILAGTFRTRREWSSLFYVSLVASFFVAFYGLLEYSGEISSLSESSRIISTLGNPLYVAAYLSFHIFLAAFLWFYTESSVLRWILGAALFFELVVFFLTGARGAFIGMLAGAGVILVLSLFVIEGKRKKIILACAIAVILSVPMLLNFARDYSFVRNHAVLSRFADITLQAGESRFILWGMGWESFKERPILGWGMGNFTIPYAKYYDPKMFGQEPWFDRTHNMPLEWLVTGGIVGFLAYSALFISIVPALVRGVRRKVLLKKTAPIFVGMFVAYLVQLLFVFDTLATYLMFIMMLAFLHVASTTDEDTWLKKNALALSPSLSPEEENKEGYVSKKRMKALQKEVKRIVNTSRVSFMRAGTIAVAFLVATVLIAVINVRPAIANKSLIMSLRLLNEQRFPDAKEGLEKALKLAKGTVGTTEIREHSAFEAYKLFSSAEEIENPGAREVYNLIVGEVEKQVQENSEVYLNIKHNILLAQLYQAYSFIYQDEEVLNASVGQYERVLQFAPNYLGTLQVFANLLARMGNVEGALEYTKKTKEILTAADQYSAEIFYSEPLFYTVLRRYDEAYNALVLISEHYGGSERRLNAGMMENIVSTTRSQGRDAAPFLEKVRLLDDSIVSVPLMLAQIYAVSGESLRARFYAADALKKDPSLQERVDKFYKALDSVAASSSESISLKE